MNYKLLGKSLLYTIILTIILCILISFCNGNEIFVTLLIFGIGIIFTIFTCTLLIVDAINNRK
ncbi:MAG: hypothetical protein E6423_16740 [Clostridium sp.]|uniref:hypothetical protein n=1 Tax=Clostridium TaxID=1485 RepID=UPI000DD06826|nr:MULTISPECIES: hypothetical protein [Clostridium]MDU1032685.1 hypothetical protein [Clostridium sp.]MDU6810396.1 hypothetical protein [Clostridium sp.]